MRSDSIMYQIFQNIPVGVIAIDCNEEIREINKKAKEIFGIIYKIDMGHDEGQIQKGDVVIIGDNSIGLDDGGLSESDLKYLGIEENIRQGSAFVYIGRYLEGGEFRYRENSKNGLLSLERNISGKSLKVEIDFTKKYINIKVSSIEFPYKYIKGIGHIVVLDGNSLEIKFYQSKGYTVRKEDLKSILNGSRYLRKLPGVEMETEVLGQKVTEVLGVSESIDTLIKSAGGENISFVNKYDEINGRPVRCSVFQLKEDEKPEGAFLLVEDLSEVNRIIKERDDILKKLMEVEEIAYDPFNSITGESTLIQSVKTYAKKAALSSSTILILGESGTGKSILARAIHNYSERREGKFVEINCGALSESLLESELFGYAPGAFTGAKKEGKKGLIESADGGTLFLDEISEMPLNLQVKLLHVLQDKKVLPVGSTNPKEVDVRFICASNRDLGRMVKEGTFREDLYYRINVIPIEMPPLRNRKEDLHILVQSIIHRLCKKENLTYKTLTNEAFNRLYSYDFPGNIRELENIIERAISVSEGDFIEEEDIMINSYNKVGIRTLKEIIEETERKAIINTLKRFNGDKIQTMKALNIKKTAFYEKIKKYKIKVDSGNAEHIP